MQYPKLAIASCLAVGLLAASGPGVADTVSQDVTQARQETQIWTTYAISPYLRANDLKVSVKNGKATLTGTVEDDVNKDLAKQIALGVSGIKSVDNQILVKSDYSPPKAAAGRTYGEVVDDATTTAAVKSKLLWGKHTDGMITNVDTTAGTVVLRGTAESPESKALAGRIALNTRGVVGVDNQLVVKASKPATDNKAKGTAEAAGQDMTDGWITTKVKSTFMYSSNVDGSDIDVSTKDGIVTLSGNVHSGAERALAIELATNVRGVKSVQSKGLII